jgi:serine/threonine protein kinase
VAQPVWRSFSIASRLASLFPLAPFHPNHLMSQPPFEAPPLELLGELLPAYEFELLIAVGGMGAVYKARQISLDRDVAIKILPEEMSRDPEFRASFQTEARAMARLNHPNLIGVYDSGTVAGMLYIVMEYVAGKPLYYSSYGRKIDPAQAVQIIQGICAGLGHAHENGIIHRDIKPANILLTPRAEPKIGDFGLARPSDSEGSGLVMGTPGYAAPEVLTHPTRADGRSDLFAVGVILYELLTGARQLPGSAPPSTLAEVDVRMDAIWKRATHPDPNRRYPDAKALMDALAEWTDGGKKRTARGLRPALVTAPPSERPVLATAQAAVASSPQPVQLQVGTNWTLARNLIIIAALVVISVIVWSNLEAARNQRDRENAEIVSRSKRNAEARAEQVVRDVAASGNRISDNGTVEPVAHLNSANESSLESLKRLRTALASGSRASMPSGAVPFGSGHVLPIYQPMTWHEAAAFAEEHGGHLVAPATAEELERISHFAPNDGPIWIGAGRSGREAWSLVDGRAWPLSAPRGSGNFAAVDRVGLVRATEANEDLPFLIQWQEEGSNPGSLEASLVATKNTLDSAAVVFPPGTVSHEKRNFLLVNRPLDRLAAMGLAETAGGHLAVPATPAEAEFLEGLASGLPANQRLWLGGERQGDHWIWLTGEPWQAASWMSNPSNTGSNSALILRPTRGWDATSPTDLIEGFIIEWSDDADSADPSENPGGEFDLAALSARAAELITAADKKRNEALASNARDFSRELDVWIRGLASGVQREWQSNVDALKIFAERGRVPSAVPKGVALSAPMAKICEHRAGKQREIDAAFLAETEKIRAAYHAKVTEAATAAESAGQRNLALVLSDALEAAAVLEPWLTSMGIIAVQGDGPEVELTPVAEEVEPRRGDRERDRQDERMRELERLRREIFPRR